MPRITQRMIMTTNETKPDYQIASEQAKELFDSLEINSTTSAPMPSVDDGWPSIAYAVTFNRGIRMLQAPYKLGVGHVDWKKLNLDGTSVLGTGLSHDDIAVIRTIQRNPGAQLKDKAIHAEVAAKLAKIQKIAPKPHEVFACYCNEALEATNTTFEDWCANFGYDTDSRKAEQTYNKCREPYASLIQMIGVDNITKFAELHAQF